MSTINHVKGIKNQLNTDIANLIMAIENSSGLIDKKIKVDREAKKGRG